MPNKCEYCGFYFSKKKTVCPRCKKEIIPPMKTPPGMNLICHNCGHQVKLEHKFCMKCGAQVQRGEGKVPFFHFGSGFSTVEAVDIKNLPGGRVQMGDKIYEPFIPPKLHDTGDIMKMMEWEQKAFILATEGRFLESLELLEKCLDIDPHAPKTLQLKAMNLLQLGRTEQALDSINEALEYGSHIPDIWHIKGVALNNLGKPNEALECIDRALEMNPNLHSARQMRAQIAKHAQFISQPSLAQNLTKVKQFISQGNFSSALNIVEGDLNDNPHDIVLLQLKGEILFNMKRYKEALKVFDQGLQVDPKSTHLLNGKAVVLAGMGNLAEALTCLERLIKINQFDVGAWYNKGLLHMQLKEINSAISCFDEVLKIDPYNQEVIGKKRLALRALNAPPQDVVRKTLELFDTGVQMMQNKRYNKAIEFFSESINLYPGFGEHYLERGRAYIRLEQFDKALSDFEEVLKIDPYSEDAKREANLCRMMLKMPGSLKSFWGEAMDMINDFKAQEQRTFGPNFNPNDCVIYVQEYKNQFIQTFHFLHDLLSEVNEFEWISLRVTQLSLDGFLERDILRQHDLEFKRSDLDKFMPELIYRMFLSSGYFMLYVGKLFSGNKYTLLIGNNREVVDTIFLISSHPSEKGVEIFPLYETVKPKYESLKQKWKQIWEKSFLPPLEMLSNHDLFKDFIKSI